MSKRPVGLYTHKLQIPSKNACSIESCWRSNQMSSRSHQSGIPSIPKQLHWTASTPGPHECSRKNALQNPAKAYRRVGKLTESLAAWRKTSRRNRNYRATDTWSADLAAVWTGGARWKGDMKVRKHLLVISLLLFLRLVKKTICLKFGRRWKRTWAKAHQQDTR